MLPFTILIQQKNHHALITSPNTNISLTDFLQIPRQSSFHRYTRVPSLICNIFLWLAFLSAIIVLQFGKDYFTLTIRIVFGLIMLLIILLCYVFILLESNGCLEQSLLQKPIQIALIKRELGLLQKTCKLTTRLVLTATNYYNSFRRKYFDYQEYDQSMCVRLQSFFYRNIHSVETAFEVRESHLNIVDFPIDKHRLCQISFDFHLSIIGRDADIVYEDFNREFQRLEMKFFESTDDFTAIKKLARLERHIDLQLVDGKQQELLFGQRRTCLVYDNKMQISGRRFLTENVFWIMTCIGLSWLFRAIFACLITQIVVPIHIELEGAMPLSLIEKSVSKGKISDEI